MSGYKSLIKNSYIFAIGNFGSKFITVLMLPFYTRLLSQSEYGQIDIITTTISLLLPIFTVNIVEAVVRFSLDRENYTYKDVLTNSLFIIILGYIILICMYPILKSISAIEAYSKTFYILFIIQAVHTSIKQFTRSINETKIYMISDLLNTSIFVILNIVFILFWKLGINGYLISMIISNLVDLIFLSIKVNIFNYIDIKRINRASMHNMFLYCLPLIPNSLMWWVMNISDRYILMYFGGLSATGLYSVANKFPTIISNLYQLFFKAWQISAIEEYESENRDEFYSNIFNTFFFFMISLASIYMIFNKLIIKIFVSSEFYEVWRYSPILVISVVFSSFSGFLGTNYTAAKKTKGAFCTSLIGALINILLNILLIPTMGIYGASISTMISFLTMWLFRMFDTRRFVNIKYPIINMIISIILVYTQLCIVYIEMKTITFIITNIVLLILNIYVGRKFIEYPMKKLIKYMKNKILKRKVIYE